MNIYEQNQISSNFWMIGERLSNWQILTMGILLGKERAALIDTGMGVLGDLHDKVRQITDLPLITLLTHGDPDHIGGAELFQPLYMSKLDDDLIPWALSPDCKRENLALMIEDNPELLKLAEQKMLSGTTITYQDIREGDIFDLGGVSLEAIALPGHTKGSMCFVNWEDNYAFTGDAVNRNTFLWPKRCTSLSVHLAALENFRRRVGDGMTLYFGHSLSALPPTLLEDSIRCCREILDGHTQNDPIYDPEVGKNEKPERLMQHRYGCAAIVYDADRVD